MQTPDINHRYAGWRESSKLISQIKGELVDLADLTTRVLRLEDDYVENVYNLIYNGGTDSIIDTTQTTVQRARVLLNFLRSR